LTKANGQRTLSAQKVCIHLLFGKVEVFEEGHKFEKKISQLFQHLLSNVKTMGDF
jgi:hypothetical protein